LHQESDADAGPDGEEGTQPPLQAAVTASKSLEFWHGEALDSLEGQMAEIMAEIERLRAENQSLQDENSRMLLMMDEMRGRVGKLGGHSAEVDAALEKTGLRVLINAGEGQGQQRLKDVFSRLYQDSVQRVQRYCLIRSQMLSATNAATEMVTSLSHKTEVDQLGEDIVPDLGRLSATACAALNGMWYSTDYLFRRACAYAMAQGVDSVGKVHASAVSELIEDSGNLTGSLTKRNLGVEGDPFNSRRKRGARHSESRCPPCRHGDRPVGPPEGPQPEATMRSPRKIREDAIADPEPTAFTVYVAGVREARGDLRPNEWPRLEQYPSGKLSSLKGMPLNSSMPLGGTGPKSKSGTSGKKVISGSQSLPAIPKGRSLL
jgi:regulator of replication initiation timing